MAAPSGGVILPVSRHDVATQDEPAAGIADDNTANMRSNKHPETKEPWWTVHLFRGMINDVRRRAPYYASDWLDAWDYRIVPATVYMYFAK